MTSPFSSVAPDLYKAGYSVIPLVANSKKAFVPDWSKYCSTRMSTDDIKRYMKEANLNIGVTLGEASGIVAIDFDDDLDGVHEKIKAILPSSPVSKKGEKGFTAFYRYGGEKNRSWKKKHDGRTLTIVELLSQGRQTVVPPSIHPEGKAYVYTSLDELHEVSPQDLPELPKNFNRQVDKILGQVDESDDRRIKLPLEDIEEALQHIDPDPYDDWVQVGMALRADYGEDAFEVWDNWSSGSDKYDANQTARKWKTFKRTGVTLGTVIFKAIEGGWDFSKYNDEIKTDIMSSFISLDQVEDELDNWQSSGRDMGTKCGIEGLDNLLTFRKGEVTVVSGYGNAGKSEFLDSVLVGLMKSQDDWKFVINSMEKGQSKHYDDLIHKVSRKPRADLSIGEYREAKSFLRTHVLMADYTAFKRNFDQLILQLRQYAKMGQVNGLVIDPFNLLVTKYKHSSLLAHTNHVITECSNIAKELDIHVFIVAHPTKPDTTFGKLPEMTKYSIAGGADWVNVSDNIMIVNRGDDNTTKISVEKVRDQEVDRLGSFRLKYDKYTRGYEPLFTDEDIEGY